MYPAAMDRTRRWPLVLVSVGIALLASACAGTRRGAAPSRSLALASAVRVQSDNVVGSGCLIHASPRDGAFVLTAAHVLRDPHRVLVNRFLSRDPWRSAEVVVVDANLDLALLWIAESGPAPRRVAWADAPPPDGAVLELVAAGRSDRPEVIEGRAVGPGKVAPSRVLAEGMSGAGVFHDGYLTGILYGLRVSPGPAEGRYVSLGDLAGFLGPRFAFLRTGGRPPDVRPFGRASGF